MKAFNAGDKTTFVAGDWITDETKGCHYRIPENFTVEQKGHNHIVSYMDRPVGSIDFDCWKHDCMVYRVYAYESFSEKIDFRDFMSRTRNASGLISLNSSITQDDFPMAVSSLCGWAKQHTSPDFDGKSRDEIAEQQRASVASNPNLSAEYKLGFANLIKGKE